MSIYIQKLEHIRSSEWTRVWIQPCERNLQELENLVEQLDLKRSSILVSPMPHILVGPRYRHRIMDLGAKEVTVEFFHRCVKSQTLYDRGQDSGGDLLLREAKWKERIGLG